MKRDIGDLEDVNSPENDCLKNYKEVVEKGIKYINSAPSKWVYITSFDGLKLAARYFENGSKKTVILFHGYRSNAARDFSCAVKMYLNFGFNVLLCDQRSHGRSEGKLITFGVKESRDAVSWCRFVLEKYSAEKIVLGGMSMGATTVLLALKQQLHDEVTAIVADSGFTSPVDIILKVSRDVFKINAKFFMPFLNFFCIIFGKFSLYKANTIDAVKNSEIPILFIHGKSDTFVPCEMSGLAFANATEKSKIVLIEDAEHGMGFLVDTVSVKSALSQFLSYYAN